MDYLYILQLNNFIFKNIEVFREGMAKNDFIYECNTEKRDIICK